MKEQIQFYLEGASSTLNNVLSMLNISTLNNVLSTVCPWFVHGLIFWNIKVTNSYSAQVFPSIFNCGDLYCNCGHLSSRPGQDAKKRPLWVKKHPFYKGCLRNVRGSLGEIFFWNNYSLSYWASGGFPGLFEDQSQESHEPPPAAESMQMQPKRSGRVAAESANPEQDKTSKKHQRRQTTTTVYGMQLINIYIYGYITMKGSRTPLQLRIAPAPEVTHLASQFDLCLLVAICWIGSTWDGTAQVTCLASSPSCD